MIQPDNYLLPEQDVEFVPAIFSPAPAVLRSDYATLSDLLLATIRLMGKLTTPAEASRRFVETAQALTPRWPQLKLIAALGAANAIPAENIWPQFLRLWFRHLQVLEQVNGPEMTGQLLDAYLEPFSRLEKTAGFAELYRWALPPKLLRAARQLEVNCRYL